MTYLPVQCVVVGVNLNVWSVVKQENVRPVVEQDGGNLNEEMAEPGRCQACKRLFNSVKEHRTEFGVANGITVLCQYCWENLTLLECLKHYRKAFDSAVADRFFERRLWVVLKLCLEIEKDALTLQKQGDIVTVRRQAR